MLEVISWTVVLFTAATTRYVTPSARIVDTGASLLVRKRCKAGSLSSDGHGSLRQSVDAPNAKQEYLIDAKAAAASSRVPINKRLIKKLKKNSFVFELTFSLSGSWPMARSIGTANIPTFHFLLLFSAWF